MADIPRHPIYIKYWPRPWPQAEFYYRASSIQLLRSVFPPINQENWPLPIQPPRIYAQSYSSPNVLTQVAAPTAPTTQPSWPRPLIWAFESDKNWIANPSVPLLSSGVEYIPARYDYPLPPDVIRAPIQSTFPNISISAPIAANPFFQTDWPAPRQPYRVYAEARRADLRLLTSVYPPINQEVWPAPIRPYRVYAQSHPPSLAILSIVPFVQEDWPQPIRPPIVYSPAVGANLKLLYSIAPPISQTDWPQPVRPYIVRSVSYGTPNTLLGVPPVPFAQDDWPAPRQPYRVYAEARRADIALLHSVKPPIVQTEWPNPRVPFQPPSARTWIQQAIKEVARPSGQSDWPVPRRPTVIPARHFPFPNVIVQAAITKPFLQNIWPLPIRPPVPPSRHFRLENIVIAQALTKPFLQNDWPIPIPPIFPGWARQFGQGAWPTIAMIPPPEVRFPTEGRFRSPLQADNVRPGVVDQRRPMQSDIRRKPNESPSSARDKSWRYE